MGDDAHNPYNQLCEYAGRTAGNAQQIFFRKLTDLVVFKACLNGYNFILVQNEVFMKRLLALETDVEVQALLAENDVELSLDEIKFIKKQLAIRQIS